MSIDEKLDTLQGCFGHEIRASRRRRRHSRRHASVKEWVNKMQAFWNWKLFLLVGASSIILADG